MKRQREYSPYGRPQARRRFGEAKLATSRTAPDRGLSDLQALAAGCDGVARLRGLQRLADGSDVSSTPQAQEFARAGVSGTKSESAPHHGTIQTAFGKHRIDGIRAHTDELGRRASADLGARAFSLGEHVGFRERSPSLFEATHEAVHYVQKRAVGKGSAKLPRAERTHRPRTASALRLIHDSSPERTLHHGQYR